MEFAYSKCFVLFCVCLWKSVALLNLTCVHNIQRPNSLFMHDMSHEMLMRKCL